MKNYFLLFVTLFLFNSCENKKVSVMHPDFEKNKATAIEFIELHNSEDWEAQAELLHEDLDWAPPMYGSENYGKAEHIEAMKMYQEMFDNIKFEADYWLPGVDPQTGMNDGSVRTYGTWTGVNVATGKVLDLHGYWYMNFDEDGKVIAQGDYFDFGGMINAVYPKNLVFIQVAVKKGKKDEMINLLKSERGIPTTVAYDGAIRYEMAYNDETNTVHLVGEWENYEKYAEYLNWRMTEDDFIQQMIPLMVGGANGLTVSQPNSSYTSF